MVTAKEMDYFFGKIDFSKSNLDAKAIGIMNRIGATLKKAERQKVLLGATLEILEKANNSHYVADVMGLTAMYDGAECDGNCLLEDIQALN